MAVSGTDTLTGMRRHLGDGWCIQLPRQWRQDQSDGVAVTWRVPGRSVRTISGVDYRCATVLDVLADIEHDLPPNPTGRVSEGGSNGIGVRAAWFYRSPGQGLRYALLGYSFTGADSVWYLETLFHSEDTDDAEWAFAAWRSISHES
jgi:hypothetical protein